MNKRKLFSWIILILWMLIIFCFSQQSGNSSTELSDGILNQLIKFIPFSIDYHLLSFIIRKFAHFSEYFILGILSVNVLYQYQSLDLKHIIFIILFCCGYAITDEIHQMFIDERTPKILDVVIDSFGSICGILLYKMIFAQNKKRYN